MYPHPVVSAGSRYFKDVLDHLEQNSETFTVVAFDGIGVGFTDRMVEQLSRALAQNTHVHYLNLVNCGLTLAHLTTLKEGILKNHSIVTLVLDEFHDAVTGIREAISVMKEHVEETHRINVSSLTSGCKR